MLSLGHGPRPTTSAGSRAGTAASGTCGLPKGIGKHIASLLGVWGHPRPDGAGGSYTQVSRRRLSALDSVVRARWGDGGREVGCGRHVAGLSGGPGAGPPRCARGRGLEASGCRACCGRSGTRTARSRAPHLPPSSVSRQSLRNVGGSRCASGGLLVGTWAQHPLPLGAPPGGVGTSPAAPRASGSTVPSGSGK